MTSNELVSKNELIISNNIDIKSMIYTIRGQQVMLDSDLARKYGYTVKAFNQQVKNNIERFPSDFMFQLNINDIDDSLRCKIGTLNTKGNKTGMHIKYMPYAFTEQGIYMLATVLKGELATIVSINLIRAFKQLKDLYNNNSYLLDKVIDNEMKLIEHDKKLEIVFDYISDHKEVSEKIFFKGQVYDASSLFVELISKAKKSIILIDNYIDIKTLDIFKHKNTNTNVLIYTDNNKINQLDIDNFNTQYPLLEIRKTNKFHDRFLILDNKLIYLIGASIKDAGNKCFGIVEIDTSNINKIKEELVK